MDSGAQGWPRLILVVPFGILLWTVSARAEDKPQPKPEKIQSDDAEVLEMVLSDLLNRPQSPVENFPTPRDAKPPAETRLKFSTEPLTTAIDAAQVFPRGSGGALWDGFEKEWKHLYAREQASAREAANDLARRARTKAAFQSFVPKNKRITMYTKQQEAREREIDSKTAGFGGLGPQVFRAFSPGYSADRRVAVVSLSFGWSGNFHGAHATYILVKRDDQWSVVVRNLIFFT